MYFKHLWIILLFFVVSITVSEVNGKGRVKAIRGPMRKLIEARLRGESPMTTSPDIVNNNNSNNKKKKKNNDTHVVEKYSSKFVQRFVVLHDNPVALKALTVLLHARGTNNSLTDIWLYDEPARWRNAHISQLLSYGCGPTSGHISDCLMEEIKQKQSGRSWKQEWIQQTRSSDQPNPFAVGFGLDLNILMHENRVKSLLGKKISFIILKSSNLLSDLLTQVHMGATLTAKAGHISGRKSGVARVAYTWKRTNLDRSPHFLSMDKAHERNIAHYCNNHKVQAEEITKALQLLYDSSVEMDKIIKRVVEPKHRLLEIQINDILHNPNKVLEDIYELLTHQWPELNTDERDDDLSDEEESNETERKNGTVVVVVEKPRAFCIKSNTSWGRQALSDVESYLNLPNRLWLKCSETIEATRIRLAIEVKNSIIRKYLLKDLDHVRNGVLKQAREKAHLPDRNRFSPSNLPPKTRPGP